MRPKEKIIAKDKFGTPVTVISYLDEGKIHHDLSTDGQRILLTPALAERLVKALTAWAKKARSK